MGKGRQICVVGAGSWGTTLADLLCRKGYGVDLWVREEEVFEAIGRRRVNEVFLPGVSLHDGVRPVRELEEAVSGKKVVVMAVPSHAYRQVLEGLKSSLDPGALLVAATKGIENGTLMTMSRVSLSVLSGKEPGTLACLAGPSFAKEVAARKPTAVTVACSEMKRAEELQRLFHTEFFRVYASPDLIGTELGGALKNVIAIASGLCDGYGLGHNARAALITRGLAEITRLAVALGANPLTLAGLAGMGDLVLTCTGDLSRNRTVGLKIAQGLSLDEITSGMKMVAEGVKTTRSAYALAQKLGVPMPITGEVYRILYEGKEPLRALEDLMGRELKVELEHTALYPSSP